MRDVFVEVPSGHYGAIDFGGSGTSVLMLHQIASNAQVWVPLGEELAAHHARSVRPVAIDLVAHGRTVAADESLESGRRGLLEAAEALGVERPLLVIENEELIVLYADEFRALQPRGLVVVGPFTSLAGAEAAQAFEEFMGTESLEEWEIRNEIFATGTAEDKESFLTRRTETAVADWLNLGVDATQVRSYVERSIRDTPDGWARYPRLHHVQPQLDAILAGQRGIDLYDDLGLPTWLVLGLEDVTDIDAANFRAWAAADPSRRHVSFVAGHDMPDSFKPSSLAKAVMGAVDAVAGS